MGASGRHEPKGDPAGSTGAGRVHERVGLVAVVAEQLSEAGGLVIETGEIGGTQAFLRSVNRGRALGTKQGIGYVAGDTKGGKRSGEGAAEFCDFGPTRGNRGSDRGACAGECFDAEGG